MRRFLIAPMLMLVVCLFGCDDDTTGPDANDTPGLAVFAMTNATSNAVVRWSRDNTGALSSPQTISTQGNGAVASLGSQGALALSDDGKFLLAANAGSADVTVFRVGADALQFLARVGSGGTRPVSIATRNNLVYVLNAGGTPAIAGFTLSSSVGLVPISGSVRALPGGTSANPAQIDFSHDGSLLVVTEKGTNMIDIFPVDGAGFLGNSQSRTSSGVTPFGFAFGPTSVLVVSNANAPAGSPVVDGSSLTSYMVDSGLNLQVKSNQVPTTETAAGWVVMTADGKLAFTSNTGSNSISGFRVANDMLTPVTTDGRTAVTGPAGAQPSDLALSRDGRYLYVLNAGDGTLVGYAIAGTGELAPIADASGLPARAGGLVAN